MQTVKNLYHHEYFKESLNVTYIALIPKKHDAKELRDIMPISLIGSVYKISPNLWLNG